ncbi:hypothetical protein ACF0C0_28995 [Pseudomonas aeruginosa]|uniref:hypothetical protein n=1 Tax=Pseudomonas aeruginosa TaxID=287 RepID=UPI0019698C49|nr:hypothetical protein [Pseudomonas aeruginosa]
MRAALDFIAPDGTAEQLEREACIEWRQQDADFLEAGLYAFCAEYPEEGGVLLDEEPTTAQPSPLQSEQAEAERPEVVGVRYEDGTILSAEDCGTALEVCAKVQTPLMTVAQHERITAQLHDALDESDGDRWKLRSERDAANARLHEVSTACATAEQERDAALAEVERLRQFERICEGLPQDAIDGGWTVQGIRGYAKRLEDQLKVALARVAELEMLLRKLSTNGLMQFSTVDEEMAVQSALGGAPVAQAQQLHNLDKQCRDDVARALGLRPNQERGFAWSYLLASIKSCVKASGDSAQAQHSVPDGVTVNPEALRQVVRALVGPAHHIRELQVTASLPGSPITELVKQYNAWAAAAPGKEGV